MITLDKYRESLLLVRKTFLTLAFFTFLLQLCVDASSKNFFSNLLALGPFVLTCFAIFNPRNCDIGSALIGVAVFLNITANSLAPMIGTLLEGNALTYSLQKPEEVFFHRGVVAISLLTAHRISGVGLFSLMNRQLSKIGTVLNISKLISPTELWGLGAIGLLTYVFRFLTLPTEVTKLLEGFEFLLWSPFLLVIPPYWDSIRRKDKWWLLCYYLVQVVISLVNNSRMGMIGPIALVGTGYLIVLLLGVVYADIKIIRRILVCSTVGILVLSQLVDLSTAMIMERDDRSTREPMEQFSATFNTFLDKDALTDYRKMLLLKDGVKPEDEWKEDYINNPFLARFVQIKFDDNCLIRFNSFNDRDLIQLKEVSMKKVAVLIPGPILEVFASNIDKAYFLSFSIGDLFEHLGNGGPLGSFLTGSIPVHALALYGIWYPVALALVYTLAFTLYKGILLRNPYSVQFGHLSAFALLVGFKLFTDISLDGVTSIIGIIVRDIWQTSVIFFVSLCLLKRTQKTEHKAV